MDETTNKCPDFETMKEKAERKKEMMEKLEEMFKDKLETPTWRVEVFESRNCVLKVNQNVNERDQVLQLAGKFTLGLLDRMDWLIRQ